MLFVVSSLSLPPSPPAPNCPPSPPPPNKNNNNNNHNPKQLEQIARFALRANPPFVLVDTIGEEEVATHKIPQAALVTPLDAQLSAVMHVLVEQARTPGHKVMDGLSSSRPRAYDTPYGTV